MKPKENFVTISVKGLIQDCSRQFKEQKQYFKTAADIHQNMQGIELDDDREHFIVFYLNARKRIIRKEILFVGTENECLCSPKVIFKKALIYSASSIICCHNHPTGEISPSEADFQITDAIRQAGQLLDIPLLDHIIINTENEEYWSFKEKRFLV